MTTKTSRPALAAFLRDLAQLCEKHGAAITCGDETTFVAIGDESAELRYAGADGAAAWHEDDEKAIEVKP